MQSCNLQLFQTSSLPNRNILMKLLLGSAPCAWELVCMPQNRNGKTDNLSFMIVLFWTYLISKLPLNMSLFLPYCLWGNLQYFSFMLVQGGRGFLAQVTRHTGSNSVCEGARSLISVTFESIQ